MPKKLFTLDEIDRELARAHREVGKHMTSNPDSLIEFKGMITLRERLGRL